EDRTAVRRRPTGIEADRAGCSGDVRSQSVDRDRRVVRRDAEIVGKPERSLVQLRIVPLEPTTSDAFDVAIDAPRRHRVRRGGERAADLALTPREFDVANREKTIFASDDDGCVHG